RFIFMSLRRRSADGREGEGSELPTNTDEEDWAFVLVVIIGDGIEDEYDIALFQ
ncbi:unnamed protein product, partial [Allacma fusca]